MGYDSKYGKVVTEHGDIPDDEPVIVCRARDLCTVAMLGYYREVCRLSGSSPFHLGLVMKVMSEFAAWQGEHPDRTRVPDSEAHRQRLTGE
jgi:hypothetical protein